MLTARQQRKAIETKKKKYAKNLVQKGWNKFIEITDRMHEDRPFVGSVEDQEKFKSNVHKIYQNNLYIVMHFKKESKIGIVDHLMVRRHNEAPIRSWSDMQRIKSEIIGPERIGLEIYPKESQIVDQANLYHMWIIPEDFELPFGLHKKVF